MFNMALLIAWLCPKSGCVCCCAWFGAAFIASYPYQGVPLKLKVTTLSSSASAAAEVANVELVRAKNGARVSSRHFVEFIEYIENYNGR